MAYFCLYFYVCALVNADSRCKNKLCINSRPFVCVDSQIAHSTKDGSKEKTESEGEPMQRGYHWIVCAVLIIGEMAGGGLVALPSSFINTGLWPGILMATVSAVLTGYTSVQLGDNWLMMQKRWPEYHMPCRKPYPEMAYRAVGNIGSAFVSIIIAIQQFGMSVVFLLLASNNISSFLYSFWQIKINFCFTALAVAAFITPFLMLGSAKDFWQAGFVATFSTSIAVVLMIIGVHHDWGTCTPEVDFPPVVINNFFLAYGTIMFAYGVHSVIPTLQNDMKIPNDFTKSIVLGFVVTLILYLPISILGYLVYGGSQGSSIISSLQLTWVQQTVNILITIHVTVTQIIICSPLSLQIEELFRVPNQFGVRRVIVRCTIVICVLFTALSIPKFGVILDLIGGTTITLLSMILPAIFNLCLIASSKKRQLIKNSKQSQDSIYASVTDVFHHNSSPLLVMNFCVLAFGLIGGIASTSSAIAKLATTKWELPCYVEVFMGTLSFKGEGGVVSCCGRFKNITSMTGVDASGFCTL
ncbi:hypothetical protein PFISCL1PPCAC_20722 [Pristionchus fissidentatus]|uniref:Amino acid transporter transmembrane domain-containing protein n=1 Tax=Pristionchus fissidentatus TaxID=1538716 RepID=A0AAV5WFN7_9BILA|nr:hypothetical protein PFISCL1PPCAC_20722 [Pristionchus fissidentatus]